MAMVMDECLGVEYLMPSIASMTTRESGFPEFCERFPDINSFRMGTVRASSVFHNAAPTYKCEGEPLPGSGHIDTPSQGFTPHDGAWRDLERTVIGNEVKWTCTMAPTMSKSSEMSLHCPSDETVEYCGGGGGAVYHMSDSPTSTMTADTDSGDNVCGGMSIDHGMDAFHYPKLQLNQAVDKNLLDAAGRLLLDGYSLFDLELSSAFPMISPKFEATEDCNSSGSCASDHQWSASGEQNKFDGIVPQEPCDILGQVPMLFAEQVGCLPGMHAVLEDQMSDSSLLESTLEENLCSDHVVEDKEERGVELVQKLLACAQAISGNEMGTAQQHVKRLRYLISPEGSSMERVATYFTRALSARLGAELRGCKGSESEANFEISTVEQKLTGYQMFYTSCPYLIVTHFTANQAILEAFEGEENVHVVDLDIKQGLQWPSLIQALSERRMGPPRLRITGVAGDALDLKSLVATKKRLLDFADAFKVPLEFTVIKENLEGLQPWMLGIRDNEALAVNCVSSLHRLIGHESSSLDNFLLMIRSLAPSVVTIVEQDAHHDQEFLPRFMSALHYYSSMFDSIAASCQSSSQVERETVERVLLGTDIMDIVGMDGQDRLARHEPADLWIRRMTQSGFRLRPLSSRSIFQANCLLNMYPVSKYCLTNQSCYLSIGWQDKPLYCVSSWC